MLTISVELLQGTFRADPDGTANTGELTHGEWPPAPSRLLSAMVAADGTRDRCRVTDGSELEWFEQLPAPVIHAHAEPWHQVLQPRYVVFHKGSATQSTHQEYVGRSGMQVRPGVRVAPRHSHVVYSWDAEAPTARARGAPAPLRTDRVPGRGRLAGTCARRYRYAGVGRSRRCFPA